MPLEQNLNRDAVFHKIVQKSCSAKRTNVGLTQYLLSIKGRLRSQASREERAVNHLVKW